MPKLKLKLTIVLEYYVRWHILYLCSFKTSSTCHCLVILLMYIINYILVEINLTHTSQLFMGTLKTKFYNCIDINSYYKSHKYPV